ncbi:hypothetical protein [Vibrio phage vB_VmeM-Yong XC32]|nr:hypothetical protein [Vibrio phage vB_VmeM-Yong XC31]QAX96592.1 hypothetical protein [Vibrio phage vB_VmeM-Yong XC32]QAX96910.1 hypothetical protein [Vibrio phage vB_VmeM-Yong MS31]QAX97215.1 hypothetical protein [Vibrio phage vB_VmeM-Yong MS32]
MKTRSTKRTFLELDLPIDGGSIDLAQEPCVLNNVPADANNFSIALVAVEKIDVVPVVGENPAHGVKHHTNENVTEIAFTMGRSSGSFGIELKGGQLMCSPLNTAYKTLPARVEKVKASLELILSYPKAESLRLAEVHLTDKSINLSFLEDGRSTFETVSVPWQSQGKDLLYAAALKLVQFFEAGEMTGRSLIYTLDTLNLLPEFPVHWTEFKPYMK